ncbi:MAG: short-chain dehydrogenase/reductase SDR [Hyphomonadaceae bacterium]|nr:MAG: short-chain dehydrogenase/reductase SDR [Hyphomonadaceae bacterium]
MESASDSDYFSELAMIRFDGKVVIVTGAGGGLGRCHSLYFASLGAKVVVNDIGGPDGISVNAQNVAAEITAAGGEAIAVAASVSDEASVAAMVATVMEKWGRVDVLVANAGILRDKSFGKMETREFNDVVNVHLFGSYVCIKAVWDIMKAQNYGRIVVTTSSTGLYGNFGQANYGAAKLALVGLMNTLKIEGAKNNIKVNAIAPVAATQMTKDLMPQAVLDKFDPELVSPAVAYMSADDAPTGVIMAAGAGTFAVAQIIETQGHFINSESVSVDDIAANWDKISDRTGAKPYQQGGEQGQNFIMKGMGG